MYIVNNIFYIIMLFNVAFNFQIPMLSFNTDIHMYLYMFTLIIRWANGFFQINLIDIFVIK